MLLSPNISLMVSVDVKHHVTESPNPCIVNMPILAWKFTSFNAHYKSSFIRSEICSRVIVHFSATAAYFIFATVIAVAASQF